MPIENISDTARWVAYYRAMETDRADAHFRDPYARKLAGPRGEEFVNHMPRGRQMAWTMIVRTAVFDELILDAVNRKQADLVLNLAAGLDARPWRMALPDTLRWVDVDLPEILTYKTNMLKDERHRCRYEPIAIDLREEAPRQALFGRLGAEAKRVLVLTEGLLIYLTREQVASLARDLHTPSSFRWWVTDLAGPWVLRFMNKSWGKAVAAGNAPFQFAPAEGTAFFSPNGWRELEFRSTFQESQRLNRQMSGAWLWRVFGFFTSARGRAEMRRRAGTVLLERVD
ncbi:MAG TPA: class I SAM-dependent methyltransferase [Gemmatimonadaceae bacterium]|nr:class I SAM-dependent methyltransferase [Gemmatimonadaceae bacterium]